MSSIQRLGNPVIGVVIAIALLAGSDLVAAGPKSSKLSKAPVPKSLGASGVVLVAHGKVTVSKSPKGKGTAIDVGSLVLQGSVFSTGANSLLKLVMKDGTELDLTENSKLWIESYPVGEEGRLATAILHLEAGVVRAEITALRRPPTKSKSKGKAVAEAAAVIIKTANSVQSLARGELVVVYDPAQKVSQVVSLRGQTHLGAWTDSSDKVISPLLVGSGMFSKVTRTGHVVAPRKMAPNLIAAWRDQAQIRITNDQMKLAMSMLKSIRGSPRVEKNPIVTAQRLPARKGTKRVPEPIKMGPTFDGDDEPILPRVILHKKKGASATVKHKHQPEKRMPASVEAAPQYDSDSMMNY